MIRFLDVVVRYPHAAAPAVDGVSFDAPEGTITAIVGPNGSGKSTLVRALLGRVALQRGTIEVDGEDASTLDRRALARRVAVVSQREKGSLACRAASPSLLFGRRKVSLRPTVA